MKNICKKCNTEFKQEYTRDLCEDCRNDYEEQVCTNKYSGTKTEKNLMTAFAGESQARCKYTYFASIAKKEGFEQISQIFTETSDNELAHAKMWFKELNGLSTTLTNLSKAAEGEHNEWSEMYVEFSKVAEDEGFLDLAFKFKGVAEIEKQHENTYIKLHENIVCNKVFEKNIEVTWHCRNCGHLHIGKIAQKVCPVCQHPQSYFEVECNEN